MSKNYIGLHKYALDTPNLVIDKVKLEQNLALMQGLAAAKGVAVRAHAKTHKCSNLAKLQLEYGCIGICVAKVSEALVFARAGVRGLLLTSPVVTKFKITQLIEVLRLAPDTLVVVDNIVNVVELNQALQLNDLQLNILVDIDAGIGRTGVALKDARGLIDQLSNFAQIKFCGVQCYAGHLQHIADLNELRQQSHAILTAVSKLKRELLDAGINCVIQTSSGTGTFSLDAELNEVTEIQPGSYCVMDQEYSVINYKEQKFSSALTLLTSVISANHTSHVTVDAGTKALYRVATLPRIVSHLDLVYDWDGFGDEHGKVSAINSTELPKLGEVLELVVAHCDPTINLFDCFYITENDIVIDRWEIDARGGCQ